MHYYGYYKSISVGFVQIADVYRSNSADIQTRIVGDRKYGHREHTDMLLCSQTYAAIT